MYEQYLNVFEFVELNETDKFCCIRLLEPPYTGIVLYLAKQFTVSEENGQQNIVFDYDVIEAPPGVTAETTSNDEFHGLLSGILLALIERHINKQYDLDA